MSTIRLEVAIDEHGWVVTSADLPQWKQRALNPTHLGVLVREAHRQISHRTAYLQRLNDELPSTERADACMTCGDVFTQVRRGGCPWLSCESCRKKPPAMRTRRRIGHLRIV